MVGRNGAVTGGARRREEGGVTSTEYQQLALLTAPGAEKISPTREQMELLLGGMGAAGEAGEIADDIKKHVFHGHPLDASKLTKEMGDVLWYLNYLAHVCLHTTLEAVMEANINKLAARYPEGTFSIERSVNRVAGDV